MLSYQNSKKPSTKSYLFILVVILLTSAVFPAATMAVDVTGTWKGNIDTQVGIFKYTYILKQDGTKITGKIQSDLDGVKSESVVVEGKLTGDVIEFVENMNFQGTELKITYKGKVSGDEISFTRQVGDFGTETFVAKREKSVTPPALP